MADGRAAAANCRLGQAGWVKRPGRSCQPAPEQPKDTMSGGLVTENVALADFVPRLDLVSHMPNRPGQLSDSTEQLSPMRSGLAVRKPPLVNLPVPGSSPVRRAFILAANLRGRPVNRERREHASRGSRVSGPLGQGVTKVRRFSVLAESADRAPRPTRNSAEAAAGGRRLSISLPAGPRQLTTA
jgi:hypothetical protein